MQRYVGTEAKKYQKGSRDPCISQLDETKGEKKEPGFGEQPKKEKGKKSKILIRISSAQQQKSEEVANRI